MEEEHGDREANPPCDSGSCGAADNSPGAESTGITIAAGGSYYTAGVAITNLGTVPVTIQAVTLSTSAYWPVSTLPINFINPPAYEPPPYEGIVAGEIIAWRCWRILGDRLKSISMDTIWEPNVPMEGPPDPGSESSRGVYALKTKQALEEYTGGGAMWHPLLSEQTYVYGEVALWGDVVEHEQGYRAQFARIVSIYSPDIKIANKFREIYGLPLIPEEKTIRAEAVRTIRQILPRREYILMGIAGAISCFTFIEGVIGLVDAIIKAMQ